MISAIDNCVGAAIDRTIQYFALFRYPLQIHEIRQYCGVACTEDEIQAYMDEQELQGNIFSLNGYYTSLSDVAALLERRIMGNQKAVRDLEKAKRVGRLIYQFPFVSYVGISGSLSKGYSDDGSDFDFFIITHKDRLWICRTLLHVMKKLSFLVGQQHKLCMNYFIDESALSLQEKNIYTATELHSLIPVCGPDMHRRFLEANAWSQKFLPNYRKEEQIAIANCSGIGKRLSAALINVFRPVGFNKFLMKLTDTKWRRKWYRKGYPMEDYDLAFKTRINISKNHHLNYQKRVLSALRLKEE
jgi:hypothetical protein